MLSDFCQVNNFTWVCDGILSKQDCSLLIKEALPQLKRAGVLVHNETKYNDTRKAFDAPLVKENYEKDSQPEIYSLLERVENLTSDLTALPVENQEPLNIINYPDGGHYVDHYDVFLRDAEYYEKHMAMGGQRVSTVLFYLNDSFFGGETNFPKLDNFKITPHTGRSVFWKNMKSEDLIKESKHSGMPVSGGEKWVAVKWIREGKYQPKHKGYFFPDKKLDIRTKS
jgi:prolyl 4-hydroxylase|tara:strand:- start:1227 stop:1904 length:678 start_codon:yes stop_codon:yes gene_type:complete